MKKQIFTLLALLLTVCSGAWATVYETYTVSLDNGATVTPDKSTFFTVSSGGGYNTKYNGTYGGHDYSKGLKMNSSSSITFTTSVKSNVTIVQSTSSNSEKKFKLGGQSVAHTASGAKITIGGTDVSYTMTENTTGKYLEFVFTDVPATTNLAITNDGETGLFYVKVELTENPSAVTQLSTPEISYVAATGSVTIGVVEHATKVTYTTDGTNPTAESTTYNNEPFVVADGTVVKAIAIGTGSYSNSDIASETVLLTGIKIATPVITKFNGAVAITCTNSNVTIKYSTNGGATYNTYARPFTLTADANVLAHAERAGCTNSDDASADITVPVTNKTKTIYLDYNDFTISTYTATGKAETDASGYVLTIGNTSKSWSSNNFSIKTRGGNKREFKLSNGAQNTLTIPAGVHVTKLTIYSIVNAAKTSASVNGWKEVGEVDYQTGDNDYKNVPMGAFTDVEEYNTNPDVRVYDIDQTGGTITFTNAGTQLCFVLALDILESSTTITPAKEYVTYVAPTNLNFTGLDLKAYVATSASASEVTMVPVTTVPAGTPLVLKKGSADSYDVPVLDSAPAAPAINLLKVSNGAGAIGGDGVYDYILSDGLFYHASAGVLPAGKAYLHLDSAPAAGARELSMSFEDEATGISEATLLNDNGKMINDNCFDLQGRKVANPTKGLYIVNGKKVIIK